MIAMRIATGSRLYQSRRESGALQDETSFLFMHETDGAATNVPLSPLKAHFVPGAGGAKLRAPAPMTARVLADQREGDWRSSLHFLESLLDLGRDGSSIGAVHGLAGTGGAALLQALDLRVGRAQPLRAASSLGIAGVFLAACLGVLSAAARLATSMAPAAVASSASDFRGLAVDLRANSFRSASRNPMRATSAHCRWRQARPRAGPGGDERRRWSSIASRIPHDRTPSGTSRSISNGKTSIPDSSGIRLAFWL